MKHLASIAYRRVGVTFSFILLATVSGCDSCNRSQSFADAASDAAVVRDGAASSLGEGEEDGGEDEVRPVYPLDVKPDPVAAKLCEALHGLPEKTRSTCCSETPGFMLTSECTRVVSGALQLKAVTLQAADVDRCVQDLEKSYVGCDWVGSHKMAPPDSCEGILHGVVAAGARCRSSIECPTGQQCVGVGPTDMGRCSPPGDDGASCGSSVDVLERYTRQQDPEKNHPVCKGICDHHRCVAQPAVGAACKASVSCGPGKACVNEKCAVARVQKIGDPCADGECAKDNYCISGKCVGPQPEGADCATDFECIGACLLPDGGKKGKCGKRCTVASPSLSPRGLPKH